MKNFLRAVKFALRYRGRLATSLVCALIAAALWGLTFPAVYPVLQILGEKKSLQEWVNGRIVVIEGDIKKLGDALDEQAAKKRDIDANPPGDFRDREQRKVTDAMLSLESKLADARSRLWRHQQLKHHVIRHLPNDLFQTLALILGAVIVAVALKGVFEFWQESLVGVVVARTMLDIRARFFRSAVHQDLRQIQEGGSAELMSRFTNDIETTGAGLKLLFGRVVGEPLRALACLVVALWISWQLTLLFVLVVPAAVFIMTLASRKMKRASRRVLEHMAGLYKILQETFQGLRIVKAYTMEPYERRRFHDAARAYANKYIKVTRIDALAGPLVETTGIIAVSLALLAGAYLVLSGGQKIWFLQLTNRPLETAALLTLYTSLLGMADPIRKLSSVYTKLQAAAAACDRVFTALDRMPEVGPNPDGPKIGRHARDIESPARPEGMSAGPPMEEQVR
jgi:ATP-binding cassette subfamily B protein/subfamily B ATP-binding cassette protein MsbA